MLNLHHLYVINQLMGIVFVLFYVYGCLKNMSGYLMKYLN